MLPSTTSLSQERKISEIIRTSFLILQLFYSSQYQTSTCRALLLQLNVPSQAGLKKALSDYTVCHYSCLTNSPSSCKYIKYNQRLSKNMIEIYKYSYKTSSGTSYFQYINKFTESICLHCVGF